MNQKPDRLFWTGLFLSLLSICFLIGSLLFQKEKLQKAKRELAEVTSRIEQEKNSLEVQRQQLQRQAGGLDFQRALRDLDVLEEFCSDVLTWQNAREFESTRDKALSKWGLDPESDFMKRFIGENRTFFGVDGQLTSEIEAKKLNMAFEDLDLFVTDMAGDRYTYSGHVNIGHVDVSGGAGTGRILMEAVLDGEGRIVGMSAWSVAE